MAGRFGRSSPPWSPRSGTTTHRIWTGRKSWPATCWSTARCLVVAGSTGEAPTLTHDEKADLWRATDSQAAEGQGQGHLRHRHLPTPPTTIDLRRSGRGRRADGALVVTPYYNKPPQRGLVAHFTRWPRNRPPR